VKSHFAAVLVSFAPFSRKGEGGWGDEVLRALNDRHWFQQDKLGHLGHGYQLRLWEFILIAFFTFRVRISGEGQR
jgi:hypothetical protein